MKQVYLGFLLLSLSQFLSGQILHGRVLDAETQEPIPLASVFFDGTFAGTSTDEKGNFKLDISKYISRPLSFSAIGYSPYSLENLDPGKSYSILLVRDLYEIEEASVIGDGIARKRKAYMRIFKSEFIGLTTNSRRCYIMNEEDITFNYNSDQDTIRARAHKPIEIHNDALGYHLEYHLESFEFVKETQKVSYQGSIVFTFDLAWEGYRSKVFKRRRRYAYVGSNKEFIRKLWQNSLKSSGYSIRDYSMDKALKYEDVVFLDSLGRKNLKYPGVLEILYYNYSTKIGFLKEEAFIDQDGFFDPTAIIWSGKMAHQRIADFLPYEYSLGR